MNVLTIERTTPKIKDMAKVETELLKEILAELKLIREAVENKETDRDIDEVEHGGECGTDNGDDDDRDKDLDQDKEAEKADIDADNN